MSSDVARFREMQALAEEAGRRALNDPAVVANHTAIIARTEDLAARFLAVVNSGDKEAVKKLVDNDNYWK